MTAQGGCSGLLVARAFQHQLPLLETLQTPAKHGLSPKTACRASPISGAGCAVSNGNPPEYAEPANRATDQCMNLHDTASRALSEVAATDSPFDLDEAHLFVVSPYDDIQILGTHRDVYEALEILRDNMDKFKKILPAGLLDEAVAIGVVSTGWAAPLGSIGEDEPASASPERRRCRVSALVSTSLEIAIAAVFDDPADEPMVDTATGEFGIPLHLRLTMEALLCDRFADQIRALQPGDELEF